MIPNSEYIFLYTLCVGNVNGLGTYILNYDQKISYLTDCKVEILVI